MSQLYEDYLSSGENWMQSSVMVNATRRSTQRRKGKYRMIEFKSLKEKYGVSVAKTLRDQKKDQESTKPSHDGVTYWMEHPDLPGKEDWHAVYFIDRLP